MLLYILFFFRSLLFFAPATEHVPESIYDFKVAGLSGGSIDFSNYKGKKILIVNTTSKDGENIQYSELDSLYRKYNGRLVIVGFLIDDFGEAPVLDKETAALSAENYKVTF